MESNLKILKKQLNRILSSNKFKEGIVISLNGYWGVGKTYFWKKYAKKLEKKLQQKIEKKNSEIVGENENTLRKKISNFIQEKSNTIKETSELIDKSLNFNKNAKVIYISLFGLHSIKDIKSKIFTKMSLKNEYLDKFQKMIGTSKTFGIDLSNAIDSFKSKDYENIIICFDDFERISSNLNIREVLGFISELKEDKKCKLVIINNNGSLKEEDKLNIKKIISNDDKAISDKVVIQTNNSEIFSLYAEKIIDFEFYYNPTIIDNLDSIKKSLLNNEQLKFIKWELIEEFIENKIPNNKKCNMRYMKKFIYKFLLFDGIIEDDISESIKKSIVLKVLSKVYEYKEDIKFEYPYISSDLESYVNMILDRDYIDKQSFVNELKNVDAKYKKFSKNNEADKKNNDFRNFISNELNSFYTSDKKGSDFVSEIYNKLIENENNLSTIYSFNIVSIIKDIKKIDSTLDNKLEELQKTVIKNILREIKDKKIYETDVLRLCKLYQDDEEITELCNNYLDGIKIDINEKDIYEKIKIILSSSYINTNVNDLILMKNIDEKTHIEYIKRGEGYFKICLSYIERNFRTLGDVFFDENTIKLMKTLIIIYKENDEIYKNKIKRFFTNIEIDLDQKSRQIATQKEIFDEISNEIKNILKENN
ncbi:P-loop NTPase fold protein [Aliarcobacter butzleri]|uniref:P-loop NTPase fold protein n=1 Tax=Aliarcobacter butzleri TaxID=28197 RepID=UPI0012605012|nr:P-loop NTPase fold protein [Aliarcobacter butzleri]